jgi:hypothetical protein
LKNIHGEEIDPKVYAYLMEHFDELFAEVVEILKGDGRATESVGPDGKPVYTLTEKGKEFCSGK